MASSGRTRPSHLKRSRGRGGLQQAHAARAGEEPVKLIATEIKGVPCYLHVAIDSGGMDVYWSNLDYAHHFKDFSDAWTFLNRVMERYPKTSAWTTEAPT